MYLLLLFLLLLQLFLLLLSLFFSAMGPRDDNPCKGKLLLEGVLFPEKELLFRWSVFHVK